MNKERALNVLLSPHISEKATQTTGDFKVYGFKVIMDATKVEVKQAVESLFNVTVQSVNILRVKSKPARFGRIMGRRKAWKKAYVTLTADQEIDTGISA